MEMSYSWHYATTIEAAMPVTVNEAAQLCAHAIVERTAAHIASGLQRSSSSPWDDVPHVDHGHVQVLWEVIVDEDTGLDDVLDMLQSPASIGRRFVLTGSRGQQMVYDEVAQTLVPKSQACH